VARTSAAVDTGKVGASHDSYRTAQKDTVAASNAGAKTSQASSSVSDLASYPPFSRENENQKQAIMKWCASRRFPALAPDLMRLMEGLPFNQATLTEKWRMINPEAPDGDGQ
ncbi:MAG: hypothetical protein EBX40_07495, partial [Gammaproteobacteria bacterium]|nr:hypothetical protein [Gammaproteobacteria bacterium]